MGTAHTAEAEVARGALRRRYEVRAGLRPWARDAGLKSVSWCGLSAVPGQEPAIEIGWRPSGRVSAQISGVVRCNSPFCRTCGPRRAAERAGELVPQLRALEEQGRTIFTFCLTMAHTRFDDIGALVERIGWGWRACMSGKAGQKLRADGFSYVRGLDLTIGEINGAHLHIHGTAAVGGDEPEAVMQRLLDTWTSRLAGRGVRVHPKGLYFERARSVEDAAFYVMDTEKGEARHRRRRDGRDGGAVIEAVGAAMKWGNGVTGGRTLGDLAEAAVGGDRAAGKLWQAAARALMGRHMVTTSRDLRLTPEPDVEVVPADRVRAAVLSDRFGQARATLRRLDPKTGRVLSKAVGRAIAGAARADVVAGVREDLTRYLGPAGDLWQLEPIRSEAPPRPAADPDERRQERREGRERFRDARPASASSQRPPEAPSWPFGEAAAPPTSPGVSEAQARAWAWRGEESRRREHEGQARLFAPPEPPG